MTVGAPIAFNLADPLPMGTTMLEASAGTGKTFTIGALVARYVAEGHTTIDQLLVVTFGRVASQELRERVREQLVAVHRGLADPIAARRSPQELLALLADTDDHEVDLRRRRVGVALSQFDAATIATTHQFCQQVLTGLGVAGDSEPGATLVEDLDELVLEVVDDLYVRRYGPQGADEPIFTLAGAVQLARDAVRDGQAQLEPKDAEPGSPAAVRRRFAEVVREEVDRRKRDRGLLGYDDLLKRLADTLGPDGAAARERMRSRWSIVLVDEFQDTDPVQWDVLRLAFAGHATMILIGDPKQAIYAFRGGDVVTYLVAARTAATKATLTENWRTDAPVVAALHALMGGAELGDPEIVVRPVTAIHQGSRLTGAPSAAPVRLRVLRREQAGVGPRAKIAVKQARTMVAADLAADVAGLLAAAPQFDGKPLQAGDVAVLVGTHEQSGLVRDALAEVGVPSVMAGAGSVYGTLAGEDWLVLLEALEQPHRAGRVRAAALTPFFGRTATELGHAAGDGGPGNSGPAGGGPAIGGGSASGGPASWRGAGSIDDRLTDELGATLRQWSRLLTERGVAALLEVATIEQQLPGRLLAQRNGGRRLTDLRHVGEGLQEATIRDGLGLPALTQWLRNRRAQAAGDQSADRTRRLDSDAAAVQVVTLHASKGLQFPVVYLPFVYDRWVPPPDVLLLHDEQGKRVLDVGGTASPGRVARQRQAATEQAGEALRLLYVGLTRAQSQIVTWWAPSTNTPDSGLHRLLFGRGTGGSMVPEQVRVPGDDEAAAVFAALEARGGPVIEAAVVARWVAPGLTAEVDQPLHKARFSRVLDTAWRRTSYSALSAAADGHGAAAPSGAAAGAGPVVDRVSPGSAGVSSEAEDPERDDEAVDLPAVTGDDGALAVDREVLAVLSPMGEMPAGTSFGTLVHAVLETADPSAPDLLAELRERCAEQLTRRPAEIDPDQLAAALLPVLGTPLGPLADGLALRDIAVGDRLTELDFEFPLAGGDRADGRVSLGDVAGLVRRSLSADDPLAGYADRLAEPGMAEQPLRGYLTGSLDAVFRFPGPRYVVADYKTNWLGGPAAGGYSAPTTVAGPGIGPPAEPSDEADALSAWHYRPAALTAAMAGSDYPLQSLLYGVALHRFLRWRQPGYDPERHLGGVLYLFVRGMCGPDTPVVGDSPCGVFGWRPPVQLLVDLSALLDQGAS